MAVPSADDTEVPLIDFATTWEGIASRLPDADALAHGELVRSWAEFEERAARLAAALGGLGVGHDDKVALYLHNGPEYLETQFALLKNRAVPCNVNYRYRADELAHLLDNSDAVALVFDRSLAEPVAAVLDRCPRVRALIQVGGGELLPGAHDHESLIVDHDPAPPIARSGDDLWFLYTGGTTGVPKAVMWRQQDLIGTMTAHYRILGDGVPETSAAAVAAAVELHRRRRATRLLVGAPLIHGTSGVSAVQYLTQGGMVATLASPSLDADEVWTVVQDRRITMLTIVGDAFSRPLLDSLARAEAEGRRYDLSSLRHIVSSGVMWSAAVKEALLGYADVSLVDTLGSSEGPGMASKVSGPQAEATTARFELGPRTAVLDESGRPIEPGSGQQGFLALGGAIPVGYYKDEAKSAETFREIDGRRWSIPGDLATVEPDGSITLLGRGSAVINSGGEKIFVEEVEEALKSHPHVRDANVVGLPDERWGQKVAAVVEPEPGVELGDDDLVGHVRSQLAGYKVPRTLVSVERIQRGDNGKPDYSWARSVLESSTGTA